MRGYLIVLCTRMRMRGYLVGLLIKKRVRGVTCRLSRGLSGGLPCGLSSRLSSWLLSRPIAGLTGGTHCRFLFVIAVANRQSSKCQGRGSVR